MEKNLVRGHKPLKIALIGYGKMGKIIESKAAEQGCEVVSIIKSKSDLAMWESIESADICIDFSHPHAVLENVKHAVSLKKNIIVGTTGWEHSKRAVMDIVNKSKIGFLSSPNFSLGIALFIQLIENAYALINPFNCYDVAGIEIHHNQKIDAPSGTAKAIEDTINSTRTNGNMHFSSVRVGNIPGTHTVIFDSPEDTITLTHTARNRNGFAIGALMAAKWLCGKQGIYTMKDMVKEMI